jgi:putative ABC transport system permease protein
LKINFMFINNITMAWRNLTRNKMSSFINIGGLSIGMAVALITSLWIHEEFSFNKTHLHYNHIVQVMQHQRFNGDDIHTDKAIPMPLAAALREGYGPDFTAIVLSSWTNTHLLKVGNKTISRPGNYMERAAPSMLSLEMLSGSLSGLQEPSSILLSASVAKAMFGNTNIAGKIVTLDTASLKVTGVYQDIADNSSFNNLSFIAPWSLYASSEDKEAAGDWNQNSFQLFAEVADNRKITDVSASIKDIKARALGADAGTFKPVVFLQPMSRWHLYADFKNGVNTGGAIGYVRMFGVTGFFVLLLACINFMNLSTARSEKRAREVGIRKAVGSRRHQLITQFYTESVLVAACAFALSLVLSELTLPFFNMIAGKQMTILWNNPLFWLTGLGFTLITGIIAGSYPAIYLSSFQPVKVLKGVLRPGNDTITPRKALVVVQFAVSVILIIGTIVVYRQVQFARNRPAGYDSNGLIVLRPYSEDFHQHFAAMRNDLLQSGAVTAISESGNSIAKGSRSVGGLQWKDKTLGLKDEFTSCAVTTDYGKTVGWEVVSGRDFSAQTATDSAGIIINEAAAKYMGLAHPIGETIKWNKTYTIIGVIKNVVMTSPYEPVKQAFYFLTPQPGYLNIRIKSGYPTVDALAKIEAVCKKYSSASPFDYKFADEEYALKFSDEQRTGQLVLALTVLAIFISCLGLFALASFVAEQRTREIGLRKVLGATVFSLWRLQAKEFTGPVFIALLIALPAAYYWMHSWLENYQYRTKLDWWIFAGAGFSLIIITLLSVSYQGISAAIVNPVKSLRTE